MSDPNTNNIFVTPMPGWESTESLQPFDLVSVWGQAVVGQKMNMEIDMLARYVARLAAFDKD